MKCYPGLRVGALRVIQRVRNDTKTRSPNLKKRVLVECQAPKPEDAGGGICGHRETIPLYYLHRKPTPKTSCGCLNKGLPTRFHDEYSCWYMMNVRCQDPNHVSFKHYGGRGIRVCDAWDRTNPDGFANFLQDMGRRPSKDYSLDRFPNVETGNYEKGNVRWATSAEQAANQRRHQVTRTSPDIPIAPTEFEEPQNALAESPAQLPEYPPAQT